MDLLFSQSFLKFPELRYLLYTAKGYAVLVEARQATVIILKQRRLAPENLT